MKLYKDYTYEEKLYLIYTLKCPLQCEHCLTNSSPFRNEKMELELAIDTITQMVSQGIKIVQLTGGEIFIYYDELLTLIETISSLGACAMLETNCFWAKDITTTRKVLQELEKAGLQKIMTSADNYHRNKVPFDNIVNVWKCSQELNIENIVLYINDVHEERNIEPKERMEILGIQYEENDILSLGRAKSMNLKSDYDWTNIELCDSIGITVLYSGDVFGCCAISDNNENLFNTPLYLGNIKNTSISQIVLKFRTSKWIQVIKNNSHLTLYNMYKEKGFCYELGNSRSICDWCKEYMQHCYLKNL